ncbi:MAG: hypothetical protein AAFQ79_09205 [Pseudomonadota bacterium]
MSISIIIKDTHAAVQRLIEKGASKDFAEEIVATVSGARVESELATRADLFELRAEMYRALLIHGFVTVTAVIGSAIALASILGANT